MIPLAPSLEWYSGFLRGESRSCTKGMARCAIASGQLLSVPIEGGAGTLRAGSDPPLSQHGRWQEVHLGAWRACYGRMPWFQFLFPGMEAIYRDCSHASFSAFTIPLFELAQKWIGDENVILQARKLREENPDRFRALASEFGKNIDPRLSIFDALFRLGRDTIWVLLHEDLGI